MIKEVFSGAKFYRAMQTLFEEIDQESIHANVERLRSEHPDRPPEELAAILTRRAAVSAASVGAAAGIIEGPFGLLAMAPDIFNLVRQQSRLVLSIAFLYGQTPRLPERFREVLAVLAVSTSASAARRGIEYFLEHTLEEAAGRRVVRKFAGKMLARKLPDLAPILGSAIGAAINWGSVRAVGKAAVAYYSTLQLPAAPPQEALPPAADA